MAADECVGSYEHMADIYASMVDSQPANAMYERPNTMSLLPENMNGLNVLDAGCGNGWYAEQLIAKGANVTAFDVSETMVQLTNERLKGKITSFQANLDKPLTMVESSEFDLILAPLVIHYVEDWNRLFLDFSRILKPGGQIVLSTHHPFIPRNQRAEIKDYFQTELVKEHWKSYKADVQFYHHPLVALTDALWNAGFLIERMIEPKLSEDFRKACPKLYDRFAKEPWFLFVRAVKK